MNGKKTEGREREGEREGEREKEGKKERKTYQAMSIYGKSMQRQGQKEDLIYAVALYSYL